MKGKDIKSFTEADLEARRALGESQTNLVKVRAKSEVELEQDIAEDSDFCDIPNDWVASAEAMMPIPKKLLSLRLDPEVIDWFKQQGPGYQTRINSVLRAFVDQAKSNPVRRASKLA